MSDWRELTDAFWAEVHEAARTQETKKSSSLVGFKPLHSEALAVHPDQIPEARESAKKKGVPVDFDKHGRPIFTSSRQLRKYAQAYGFRHYGY